MGIFGSNGMGNKNGSPSVEQEMKRSKVKGWVDVVLCIVIVVVVLLYRESTGSLRPKIAFYQNCITVSCTEEDSRNIVYDTFESVEMFEDFSVFDKGELVRGTDVHSGCSGVFRNAEFGEYYLCVTPKFEKFIIVHQPDCVIVFNYESEDSTEDVYRFLQQMLDDRQA